MGYGAFMTVKNELPTPLQLFVEDTQCMYDGGQEGSNLSLFNDVVLQSNQILPASGRQYIEAKASGGCFLEPSSFTLNASNIGKVTIVESGNNYYANDNTNPDALSININNSGDQAVITVIVHM
ncbi:hypothetical protein KDH_01700 [Dictyobacter sp. S3.2.2.5]|uniref:Uncharacterized protein n=1 Tax=Dictyobacter halimunensis TaxID=3026934 RepID=A0ABQ6FH41_9CHLR|nr:hypothetical protein KDH_01700 [Dictyobacter sp. S3.2.2.5]